VSEYILLKVTDALVKQERHKKGPYLGPFYLDNKLLTILNGLEIYKRLNTMVTTLYSLSCCRGNSYGGMEGAT
jgi:hypothetical protein